MLEGYNWGRLNPLQLGRYAEYFAKMEFTRHGFDVYTAEVDDKGIDFIVRKEYHLGGTEVEYRYYDVQVKSVRRMNYVFFRKDKLMLRDNLLATSSVQERRATEPVPDPSHDMATS
jgi:hypothetical protein